MEIDTLLARLRHLGTEPPPLVNVLRLEGMIGGRSALRRGLALSGLAGVLHRAFKGPNLKAVALAINSPGGSPVQSSLIAGRIRRLSLDKKVPVFAFVEDVAASGGYWLALAADEIFADPASLVGSIGVVAAGFGFQGLMDRVGVERRMYTQGAHKAMLDPFRAEDPEDVVRLKALQADIHDVFKATVRERRAGRLKVDEALLFEGDIWTGRRAVELGLVDGLGDMLTVMRGRFGEQVRLRVVGQRRGWLTQRLGLSLVQDALAVLDERAAWARWGL